MIQLKKLSIGILATTLGWLLPYSFASGQIITTDPVFPTASDSVTITYDANQGNGALRGTTATVFAHIGVVTSSRTGTGWQFVQGNWGTNDARVRMTSLGNNRFRLGFRVRSFFTGLGANTPVFRFGMVFRNQAGDIVGRSSTGEDIFVQCFQPGEFGLKLVSPGGTAISSSIGGTVNLDARTTIPATISVTANGVQVGTVSSATSLTQPITANFGNTKVVVTATNGTDVRRDSFNIIAFGAAPTVAMPAGLEPGITYDSDTSAILCLFAPGKSNAFVIGEFNNWERTVGGFMFKSTDGNYLWKRITGLEPGREYAFQYLVDSTIRIADPYCEIVLHEDDRFIQATTYPNLKPYPTGRTNGYVGILQTARPAYQWRYPNFVPVKKEDMVVYELHIRDFFGNNRQNFQSVIDTLPYLLKLGVNAIEFMPLNEFEGNLSWGYNPSYHNALDKYYGTREAFQAMVDSCHGRGIAVIVDQVLNHGFSQNPLARLWWNSATSKPSSDSPYFNVDARHPFNVGSDFNHESAATQYYVDRVNRHWIQTYNIDGYRFDLSKGFTQVNSGTDVGRWGNYDASRIRLLSRMSSAIRGYKPNALLILEHFADGTEERELSNTHNFMFWGNIVNNYTEAAMGYSDNSNIYGSSHVSRGWNEFNLLSYMESHDEERISFKLKQFGNSSGSYNTRTPGTALDRKKLAAAFFFTIPGPKMMWQFGELGYDFSINHCGNGTINESCRTDAKPVRWDYLRQPDRKKLYDTYSALIRLKKEEEVFEARNLDLFQSGDLKRIRLSYGSEHVMIVGNFGVVRRSITANWQRTGRWYNFFAGDSIEVTGNNTYDLAPGEFRIFTTRRQFKPANDLLISSTTERIKAVEGVTIQSVYPNPISGMGKMEVFTETFQTIQVNLFDLTGRKLANIYDGTIVPGANLIEFTKPAQIKAGVYQLVSTVNGQAITQSIVIE
jgi:1,4-alpha-glucan branching enzyme